MRKTETKRDSKTSKKTKAVTPKPPGKAAKSATAKPASAPLRRVRRARQLDRVDAVTVAIPAPATPAQRPSKLTTIETLMRCPHGAPLTELMQVTGWQQHSVRAALSGLRKAGCSIVRTRDGDGKAVYQITGTGSTGGTAGA